MKYCTHCLYPETKPDLTFNEEGKCSACQAFEARSLIDWDAREIDFRNVVSRARFEANEAPYDCVIPVSGGKDSHYQVIKALEYNLRILAVTAETDYLSDIGRCNLDNISKLGIDHIIVKNDPIIRRQINNYTLETIGDISWAEHITIFSVPIRVASLMKIPLIIWGENPQNEYGGPAKAQMSLTLTQDWLNEYGGLNGLRVSDVEGHLGPIGDLYKYPELTGSIEGIFLGQFFSWNGQNNAVLAMQHGFEVPNQHDIEGSYGNYENLDNYQTGIHDYFKYLKFGFGRATDILSNHIRRDQISRQDAIKIMLEKDGAFPWSYLGLPLNKILKPLGMKADKFLEICDTFTNWDLFEGSHVRAGGVERKFSPGNSNE
jgi:N-acetyl sugar amidotransferase